MPMKASSPSSLPAHPVQQVADEARAARTRTAVAAPGCVRRCPGPATHAGTEQSWNELIKTDLAALNGELAKQNMGAVSAAPLPIPSCG
jgi:hypothetical protein